jgi:FkbM family methyltransferase
MARLLRTAARRCGVQFTRIRLETSATARRIHFIRQAGVNTVVDVGANLGQFGEELFDSGFNGRLISFEPLSSAFERLQKVARRFPNWEVHNIAIGISEEKQVINVASNGASSSFRSVGNAYLKSQPAFHYIGSETVRLRRLDSVLAELSIEDAELFVKIDTQGFEKEVLSGMDGCFNRVRLLEIELSLMELYTGQALFDSLHPFLVGKGMSLIAMSPVLVAPASGKLLQFDATYERRSAQP